MLLKPVAMPIYKRLSLEQELSMRSTLGLLRDFWRYGRFSSRTGMCWIVFSASFILLWPTLSGSMTSYSPQTIPYYQTSSGDWANANTLARIDYVIWDRRLASLLNVSLPFAVRSASKGGIQFSPSWLDGADATRYLEESSICRSPNLDSQDTMHCLTRQSISDCSSSFPRVDSHMLILRRCCSVWL
jgi:hypothetical protein